MSDIFIKTAAEGSPGWKKMTALFVKTAASGLTGWKSALGVWLRRIDGWIKVWPLSGVFSTRSAWVGPNSDTLYADRLTSSSRIRIGSNYYGNNAQWDPNGWTITSYSYAWKYYDTNDGFSTGTTFPGESGTGSGWTSGGTGQDVLPLATWTSTTSTNTDRKYLRFEVTANASNSTYSGFDASPYIQIIRRIPINLTVSLSDYTPEVGTAITYSSTWDTSEARKAESNRTTIQWYRNSTNTTTGGTVISGATSSSYTPVSADIGNYLYVVETRYNSGTDYDLGSTTGVEAKVVTDTTVADINYQATGNQRRINLPSNFTAGTIVYISTNGYIGIGSDPSGSIFPPSTGRYLMPLQGDQRQTALWTYADSSNFYVRWQGARYNDSSQTIDYQAKFYFNSTAVDVYFVTNNLSSSNPASTTAVYDNGLSVLNWSSSTSQSSTLLSTSSMTRNTTQDGVDDNRTAITALVPSPPSGGSAYLGNSGGSFISSISSGGTIYLWKTDASGNPAPTSSWVWQRNDGGTGGNTFRTVQTGGTTYTTGSFDQGYSIRAIVTWTNGVSPDQQVTTGSVSVPQPSYTVTWNANGGDGGGSTTQTAGVAHTAPSPGNRIRYTVQFNSNGATSGSPSTTSTNSLYPFSGYYDNTNIFSAAYGPISSGGSFTPPYSLTMYALWGSTVNSVTLATQNTLARTGYTFGGWNTNSSGTGTTYSAGSSYTPSSNVTLYAKWDAVVSRPSGGTVTLTGSGVAGTSLSASTQGWSGSPTSYDLTIRVSTTSTVSSTGTIKASTTSSSTSYTVTTGDANPPPYYFKAFATATNSGGTSLTTAESGTILSSRLQQPTGLYLSYNGWNGSQHSWTATWNSVTGASSYTAYREVGPDSSPFTVAHTSTPQTGITGTTTTFTTGTQANDWARFYVKAVNSLDDSGYAGPSNVA